PGALPQRRSGRAGDEDHADADLVLAPLSVGCLRGTDLLDARSPVPEWPPRNRWLLGTGGGRCRPHARPVRYASRCRPRFAGLPRRDRDAEEPSADARPLSEVDRFRREVSALMDPKAHAHRASICRRMLRAALLDAELYEEVEADRGATGQACAVVVLSAVAAGI